MHSYFLRGQPDADSARASPPAEPVFAFITDHEALPDASTLRDVGLAG
jgi:hypothetical protein